MSERARERMRERERERIPEREGLCVSDGKRRRD